MRKLLIAGIFLYLPTFGFSQCSSNWTCNYQVTQNNATSVTITWNSAVPSTTTVRYGLTTSYGHQPTANTALVLAHSFTLTGLTANSTYYYTGVDKDAQNINVYGPPLSFTLAPVITHQVNLNWNASTTTEIYGYNVYRSTDQTNWTKLNSAYVTPTTYTDSTAPNGATYYFYTTTVAPTTSGITESGPSNIATAVVPST